MLLPPTPFQVRVPLVWVAGWMEGSARSRPGKSRRKGFRLRNLRETESGVPELPREGRRNPRCPESLGRGGAGDWQGPLTPQRGQPRPAVTSCPSELISLPQVLLPTPLPFLAALPGSCSGVGGHRGQETAGLAGARQTRPGPGIPSSLPDSSPVSLLLFSFSSRLSAHLLKQNTHTHTFP